MMICTLIGILGFTLVLSALRRDDAPERAPIPIRVDPRLSR
jgi:hypothetical protein